MSPREEVLQPNLASPNLVSAASLRISSMVKELQQIDFRRKRSLKITSLYLIAWFGLGVVCLAFYSLTACGTESCFLAIVRLFSVGMMHAGGASSLGGLTGFLFGIPRTLAPRTKTERDSIGTAEKSIISGNGPDVPSQSVNTNLEDISDWLTKILVGVSLVQFQDILHTVRQVAFRFQASMGNSELAVLAIITTYFVWGFFAGYLFTRLFLTSAFGDIMSSEALRGVALRNAQLETEKTVLQRSNTLLATSAKAMTLSAQGEYTKADSLFQDAIRQSEDSAPDEFKQILLEGTVFNSLYKKPPEGYEEAIRQVNDYLQTRPDHPSPILFAYLSFACGQKYDFELNQLHKTKEQLRPVRDAAYNG